MTLLDRELETTTGPGLPDGISLRDLTGNERREVLMRTVIGSIGAGRPTQGTNCTGSKQIRDYLPDGMKASSAGEAKICHLNAAKLPGIGV